MFCITVMKKYFYVYNMNLYVHKLSNKLLTAKNEQTQRTSRSKFVLKSLM